MAKIEAKRGTPSKGAATRAFERAWKLLGRLERELDSARKEEAKRRRQLVTASGDEVVRRQAQLEAATDRAGRAAGLLTELSDLIAANARAQAHQTVSDIAHEAAEAVRVDEQARTAAASGAPAVPAARRRTPAPRPAGPRTSPPARPRARRSLQPGPGDPGQSGS